MNDDANDPMQKELSERKEVKVKIPLGFHLKLHSLKVITGKHISDAVTEALEAYFTEGGEAPPDLEQAGNPLEFLQG